MKLSSLLVRLIVVKLGMMVIRTIIGGLNTIALSGFSLLQKVALARGA